MSNEKKPIPYTKETWDFACDSGHSSPCLGKVQHSKKSCVYTEQSRTTIASHVPGYHVAQLIAAAPFMLRTLKAIKARRSGVWDDPDLMSFGALGTEEYDINRFLDEAIHQAEGEIVRG